MFSISSEYVAYLTGVPAEAMRNTYRDKIFLADVISGIALVALGALGAGGLLNIGTLGSGIMIAMGGAQLILSVCVKQAMMGEKDQRIEEAASCHLREALKRRLRASVLNPSRPQAQN